MFVRLDLYGLVKFGSICVQLIHRRGLGNFCCEQVDKKKAAEAAAVAASVRRLYRVREESGVEATRTPDIIAPAADLIEAGTAFYGKAEVWCVVFCFMCACVQQAVRT